MIFRPANAKRIYCSRFCYLNGDYKRVDLSGYAYIYVGKDYPSAYTSGQMLEHRYVMEQKLGRALDPSETVHHINGDKLDNRLENLELWASRHPRGQRHDDPPHCPTCTCGGAY